MYGIYLAWNEINKMTMNFLITISMCMPYIWLELSV